MTEIEMQIGKNGLTENFLTTLENASKKHQDVKISVLKAAEEERKKIEEVAEKIKARLGPRYTTRIVGFTIFLKRWRKVRVQE